MAFGRFKWITFIEHIISTIITSVPPQVIRHQTPEVGTPVLNYFGYPSIKEYVGKGCVEFYNLPYLAIT